MKRLTAVTNRLVSTAVETTRRQSHLLTTHASTMHIHLQEPTTLLAYKLVLLLAVRKLTTNHASKILIVEFLLKPYH